MPIVKDATLMLGNGQTVPAVLVRPPSSRWQKRRAADGHAEFESFLGVLSKITADGGIAILTDGMNAYGPPPDPPGFEGTGADVNDEPGYYPWCLVATLPGSASVRLSQMRATCKPRVTAEPHGRLFATRKRIQQLAAFGTTDEQYSSLGMNECAPVISDNRVFRDVLAQAPDHGQVRSGDVYGQRRQAFTRGIGQRMGELHNMWVYHEDAHEGNFIMTSVKSLHNGIPVLAPKVLAVDFAKNCCTYRPLTENQAATNLLPLFSTFSKDDWSCFAEGYLEVRGAAGHAVVALFDPAMTWPPRPLASGDGRRYPADRVAGGQVLQQDGLAVWAAQRQLPVRVLGAGAGHVLRADLAGGLG
jgi:hypothetical protein